jgi:hypothetical protein
MTLEARHRSECLAWLRETDEVFRRVKPRTPNRAWSLTLVTAPVGHGPETLQQIQVHRRVGGARRGRLK